MGFGIKLLKISGYIGLVRILRNTPSDLDIENYKKVFSKTCL